MFLAGLWVSGCFVSFFCGRRPEDRSGWVGNKEGVPASQSALLLGPEHSLRWGCHSMSRCDGVRPIIVRAGAVLPEGVTYTAHVKALGNPCSFRAVSLRSLETAEPIADCCVFQPAKTLVGTEWQGLSGIDGGHCGMLAGGMQIFDASVKERISINRVAGKIII